MARVGTIAALAAAAVMVTTCALAQGYPERTVEIVVPSTPGATADVLGRVLADGLTQQLGQRFIIVNKAGASGVIGTAAVAQAKPDGYTLLHGAAFSLTVQPLLDRQARYDHKSFEPICQTFKNDQVIVAHPDGPFKSAQDLIHAAKAKPGALNYGHPGNATIPHLAMIEFARLAKVEFNQVPFKGPAEAIQMTHGGQIDFAAVPLTSAATSGLRMPGLFAPARNPAIPDVLTMKEQGFDVAPLSYRRTGRPGRLAGRRQAQARRRLPGRRARRRLCAARQELLPAERLLRRQRDAGEQPGKGRRREEADARGARTVEVTAV